MLASELPGPTLYVHAHLLTRCVCTRTQAARLRDAEADAKSALQTAQRAVAREAARADALARELTAAKEDAAKAARQAADDASRASSEASAALSRARAETASRAEEAARAQAQAAEAERARQAAVVQRDAALGELDVVRRQMRGLKLQQAEGTLGNGLLPVLALPGQTTLNEEVAHQDVWLASLHAATAAAEAASAASAAQARLHGGGPTSTSNAAASTTLPPPARFERVERGDAAASGSIGSLDIGSSTKRRAGSGAVLDTSAQQEQALATLKDMQVQAQSLRRDAGGRSERRDEDHDDLDRPPRPDSAASNRSWTSLAESDPPSPTGDVRSPMAMVSAQPLAPPLQAPGRQQAQRQQAIVAQQQPQPPPPASSSQQQRNGVQSQRQQSMSADARGRQTALQSVVRQAQSQFQDQQQYSQQQQQQQQQQMNMRRAASMMSPQSSGDSRNGGPAQARSASWNGPQQPQQMAPPVLQPVGPPVEHWQEDENPWGARSRMESAAYQQWLQSQARRSYQSAPAGASLWQKAAYSMAPSQRGRISTAASMGNGGSMNPAGPWGPMQPQSAYDSLRPGQVPFGQPQQLPRGYAMDDSYLPYGNPPRRQASNGSSGGAPRGILRAPSINSMPEASRSWGSDGAAPWGNNTAGGQYGRPGMGPNPNGRFYGPRGPPGAPGAPGMMPPGGYPGSGMPMQGTYPGNNGMMPQGAYAGNGMPMQGGYATQPSMRGGPMQPARSATGAIGYGPQPQAGYGPDQAYAAYTASMPGQSNGAQPNRMNSMRY